MYLKDFTLFYADKISLTWAQELEKPVGKKDILYSFEHILSQRMFRPRHSLLKPYSTTAWGTSWPK